MFILCIQIIKMLVACELHSKNSICTEMITDVPVQKPPSDVMFGNFIFDFCTVRFLKGYIE